MVPGRGKPVDPAPEGDGATGNLARAAQEGRAGSFGDLWARVAPALYAFVRLRIPPEVRPRLDPEDVLQEVCCRAMTAFRRFDPERGSPRGWFFGIAKNVLREALAGAARGARRGFRPGGGEDPESLGRIPSDSTTLSRRVARDEGLQRFLQHVESLDADERRLFLLRGLEGLGHRDIAARLGIGAEAAAKRWERLRERLAEHAPDAELFG